MENDLFSELMPWIGDPVLLRERMANRMDLWEECVRLLPGTDFLDETDRLFALGRQKELWELIHRLKGDLAHFGFDGPAGMAAELCALLKTGVSDAAEIKEKYGLLRDRYLQIVERIRVTK